MRRARLTGTLAIVLALTVAACGCSRGAETRPRPPATTVAVVNRDFLAYTLYVSNDVQRQRLGTVQAVSTARMVIPVSFIQTATPLRFIADPIGSDAVARTFKINVAPGETVDLTIF